METILDADDCREIVQGTEVEPVDLAPAVAKVEGEDEAIKNPPPTAAEALLIAARKKEIKDYKRRYKKAASLITQSIDDGIVLTLSVHNKDPKLMWDALSTDYNNVTPAQLSLARQNFLNFRVTKDETYLEVEQRFNELLRKVVEQNGVVTVEDQLQTLLVSLPAKFDILQNHTFQRHLLPTSITSGGECLTSKPHKGGGRQRGTAQV